jgi:hypothetical protein
MIGLNSKTVLLIPPLLIWLLYIQIGVSQVTASQILFPRFDENTTEYLANLENMQYSFLFFIRLYDNLVYHLQHITLNGMAYKILFVSSILVSVAFAYMGRWLFMAIGLMILLNKTWVGTSIEAILQFLMEVIQTAVDLAQKLTNKGRNNSTNVERIKPIQVSIYENQRWWAGNGGYTSQVSKTLGILYQWLNKQSVALAIRKNSLVKYYWIRTITFKR